MWRKVSSSSCSSSSLEIAGQKFANCPRTVGVEKVCLFVNGAVVFIGVLSAILILFIPFRRRFVGAEGGGSGAEGGGSGDAFRSVILSVVAINRKFPSRVP